MTDDQFIFILKSKLKLFYQENKSVGLELKELVADFREQILQDFCRNQKPPRTIKKRKMKITLKTDPETLFLLHKIANEQCQMIATNIGRKSGKSMRIELFTILTQRCFSYSQNPNGKKLQLTLKYHLAALLYELVTDHNQFTGIYESNKIELFKNDLHQKLQ